MVLIDKVKIIVLLEYLLYFDEGCTWGFLQNFIFLTIECDFLFVEVLLEDEEEGIVAFLSMAERVGAVIAMYHFYHHL